MKWVLLCAAAALLGWLWWMGTLAELSDPDRLRVMVDDAGAAGPLAFVGLVLLLFPVMLAGPPIWLSGSLWPIPLAILYSAIASAVPSLLFYAAARRLGREWAADRIPARLRRYEERLEQHPLRTVVLLRLLLWINPAVDILVGVSAVSTRNYLIGSAIVLAPATVVHVVLPAKGIELAGDMPAWLWPALGVLLAVGLTSLFVRNRITARSG